jgi:hypothetical protein
MGLVADVRPNPAQGGGEIHPLGHSDAQEARSLQDIRGATIKSGESPDVGSWPAT